MARPSRPASLLPAVSPPEFACYLVARLNETAAAECMSARSMLEVDGNAHILAQRRGSERRKERSPRRTVNDAAVTNRQHD